MTRDELLVLYESAIIELLEATPCRTCGGDSLWAELQIRQAAWFMTEMADQWKIAYQAKQAKTMSVKKVAKRARAKMERHFNEIIAKQLEEQLSSPDEPSDDTLVEDAADTAERLAEPVDGAGTGLGDPAVDPELVGNEIGAVEPGLAPVAQKPAPVVDDLVGEPGALEDRGSEAPEERVEPTS